MKCVICKKGETRLGKVTVTLDREGTTVVFKTVPAQICQNCGEEYVNEKTASELLRSAEEAVKAGVEVDIREYLAA